MAPVHLGTSRADDAAERPSREALLEGSALEAARIWTTSCMEELTRQGRKIEGGWPGTMQEARGLVGGLATRALTRLSMPALAHDELGRIARITYVEAQCLWGASRTPATRAQRRTGREAWALLKGKE